VALHGFAHFFKEMSEEENEHARDLIKYQNMRGGRVVFQDIPKPPADDWQNAMAAVQAALDMEKKVNAVRTYLRSMYICIVSPEEAFRIFFGSSS
jgi:ferritin heavy chain